MHIIVDTREKRPIRFSGQRVSKKALKVGDYTISGYSKVIAVERKSITDFLICISSKKEHFTRQLKALSKLNYAIVVVEGRLDQKSFYCTIEPKTRASLLSLLMVTHRVPIIFASNREIATSVIFNYLRFAKTNIDIGIV